MPLTTDAGHVGALVEGATRAHHALDQWLAGLGAIDPAAPTRIDGWRVGHIITHLARNADSHVRMLAGEAQYPGGWRRREGDIETGASRPWDEQLADLAAANTRLADAWHTRADWDFIADRAANPRPASRLPFLRWREVEVHRADLGLGYRFDDMPADYLRRELAELTMLYRASRPIGLTNLPPEALAATPAARVAWLLGRGDIDGLPPAGVFGA